MEIIAIIEINPVALVADAAFDCVMSAIVFGREAEETNAFFEVLKDVTHGVVNTGMLTVEEVDSILNSTADFFGI